MSAEDASWSIPPLGRVGWRARVGGGGRGRAATRSAASLPRTVGTRLVARGAAFRTASTERSVCVLPVPPPLPVPLVAGLCVLPVRPTSPFFHVSLSHHGFRRDRVLHGAQHGRAHAHRAEPMVRRPAMRTRLGWEVEDGGQTSGAERSRPRVPDGGGAAGAANAVAVGARSPTRGTRVGERRGRKGRTERARDVRLAGRAGKARCCAGVRPRPLLQRFSLPGGGVRWSRVGGR